MQRSREYSTTGLRSSTPVKTTPPAATNGVQMTAIDDYSTSPTGFQLRSSGSNFTKEYTYSPDNRDSRRAYSPKSLGFSYASSRSPSLASPRTPTDVTNRTFERKSPETTSPQRLTGVAFTYKPPTSEEMRTTSSTSSAYETGKSVSAEKTTFSSSASFPSRPHTLSKMDEMAKARREFLSQPYSPATIERSTPIRSSLFDPPSSSPKTAFVPKVQPSPSTKSRGSGTASRQSRESALDSSDDSTVSSDSDSMVDEYEKDESRHETLAQKKVTPASPIRTPITPTATARSAFFEKPTPAPKPVLTSTSPVSMNRPWVSRRPGSSDWRKSNEELKQQSLPRFTHLSRKRVVTNADGSTEETEEVIEPSVLSSLTGPSKPVVVGVVPSATPKSEPASSYYSVRLFLFFCFLFIFSTASSCDLLPTNYFVIHVLPDYPANGN